MTTTTTPASMGLAETVSAGFWWFIDGTKYCGTKAIEGIQYGAEKSWPYMQLAAEKVQIAWEKCLPYLKAFGEFLQSPVGIALSMMIGTVILMKLSEHIENKLASFALFVAGIVFAVVTGALMQQVKLLPPSIVQLFIPRSNGAIA